MGKSDDDSVWGGEGNTGLLNSGGRYDPDHVRQGIDGLTGTAALFGLIERTPKPRGRLLRVTRER